MEAHHRPGRRGRLELGTTKAVDQPNIRELRQQLIRARQECDADLLQHVIEGVSTLAGGDGYRCCLVDYSACKPAAYVRVVGFEGSRVKVQLEFPIDPGLSSEQWLPLSHLADYDEATDAESIKRIYDGVCEFVRHPEAELAEELVPSERGVRASRTNANGGDRFQQGLQQNRASKPKRQQDRGRRKKVMPRSHIAWWFFAGGLMAVSLTIFAGVSGTFM